MSAPITFTTTRSPDKIMPAILSGCARLKPGATPIFVDKAPMPDAEINQCVFNVKRYLERNPGEMVLGWEICVWDDVLLDCIGHAVVKQDGRLLCVTPSKYGDQRLLFLQDPGVTFDFEDPMSRMPSTYVPLSARPEVKRLIELEAAERAIKIKYPRSGLVMVPGEDALALQRLTAEKQTLVFKILLVTSGRDKRCPCGSGKKFRKCHRPGIERMLKFA